MVCPDWMLIEMCKRGMVEPYDEERINPASVDLCVGTEAYDLTYERTVQFSAEGVFRLTPGVPVLLTTLETVTLPDDCAAQLILKSSMGRRGVSMPAAGWVDPGFSGQLTVQLSTVVPLVLTVGQRFLQMVVYRMAGVPEKVYAGRYQDQRGVTLAR